MADPHPHYVDLDDTESTEDDEASEEPSVPSDVEDSEQDEEEEEPDVQTNSNYAIYLSRMGPRDEPSEPESDFKPGNGGKRRKIGSQETAAFETGESSQTSQWNPNEIDGLFCPICLEAWTSDGDHYIWFALDFISTVNFFFMLQIVHIFDWFNLMLFVYVCFDDS